MIVDVQKKKEKKSILIRYIYGNFEYRRFIGASA
jgi:hypothetical protein